MSNKGTSRREFVKYITFAGGILVMGGLGAYFLFKNPETADKVRTALEGHIKGDIIKDSLLLEEYRTDFGKMIRKEPRVVVIPVDEEDVINTFKIASEFEVPVSIRGAGHSCFGQSLSDGGILLVNSSSNCDFTIKNDTITVSSKTQWLKLEQKLNRLNLTSPVLTDYLELTVGGTLSVGGYGLRSFQYGGQVDNIIDMELILPEGSKIRCSARENFDIFRYALCGLGQLGLINKVRFKPINYKRITVVFYIFCRTINEFISYSRTILESEIKQEIDHFSAYWAYGGFIFEIGKSFEDENKVEYNALSRKIDKHFKFYKKSTFYDYHFNIHKARKNWVEQYGFSHHLWEDYIFDIRQLKEFLFQTITIDMIDKYQNILPVLYILACDCKKTKNIPFSPTYGNEDKIVYGVGFYYMVKIGDTNNLRIAKKQLEENMYNCLNLGGRPYLYGWHGLSEHQKNYLYRNDYVKLKELKKKYDPNNIINPGVFLTML